MFADVTSGSRRATDRPGMRKLLEYATNGDTITVWRMDRLGRSLIDVLNTVNLLTERGIRLRSLQDGIDPATTSGNLMLNMLASLAEYERGHCGCFAVSDCFLAHVVSLTFVSDSLP
ncbi:MAG: recombinase family protein [Microlunatus sp.]|nr:recombinase family protein [Microlunatus sp.]